MIRSFVAASFQPDRLRGHATSERTSTGGGQTGTSPPDGQTGAMDGRVERKPRFGSFHSVEDHRVVPHRAADEAPLAQDGGRRALAHDPRIPFLVRFTPGMVMVAVHHPREGVTDEPKTCVRIVSSGFAWASACLRKAGQATWDRR